jgi:hypothetical protein
MCGGTMAVCTKQAKRIRPKALGTMHAGMLFFHLIVKNKNYCIVKKTLIPKNLLAVK